MLIFDEYFNPFDNSYYLIVVAYTAEPIAISQIIYFLLHHKFFKYLDIYWSKNQMIYTT